jgi:hypothetical protein
VMSWTVDIVALAAEFGLSRGVGVGREGRSNVEEE